MKTIQFVFVVGLLFLSGNFSFAEEKRSIPLEIMPMVDLIIQDSVQATFGLNWELGYDFYSFDWSRHSIDCAIQAGMSKRFNAGWCSNASLAFTILSTEMKYKERFSFFEPRLYGVIIKRSLYSLYQDSSDNAFNPSFYEINLVLHKIKREGRKNFYGIGFRFAPEQEQGKLFKSVHWFFKLY